MEETGLAGRITSSFYSDPRLLTAIATTIQVGWIVAILLAIYGAFVFRQSARAHAAPLLCACLLALVARLVFGDFHSVGEGLPYITQATCIAWPEARDGYDLCAYRLLGDIHSLGTGALFALGFHLFGAYKATAGAIILAVSVANTALVYALTQRAFACRRTAFTAAALHALYPASIRMGTMTQSEVLHDTFLLLFALLIHWDFERPRAPVEGAHRALVASALFRAFFVAMAAAVRPEPTAWLPLLLVSGMRKAPDRKRAVLHAGLMLAFGALMISPTLAGTTGKMQSFNTATEGIIRVGLFALDVEQRLLGPVGVATLLLGFALGFHRKWQMPPPGRALIIGTSLLSLMYVIGPCIYAHTKPHQIHLLYHCSALWWPVMGAAIVAISRFVPRGRHTSGRDGLGRALTGGLLASVILFSPQTETPFSLSFLNAQVALHRALRDAIPPRSLVITVGAKFRSSEVAALLFERGWHEVIDMTVYGWDPPACDQVQAAFERARADGRAAIVFDDPGWGLSDHAPNTFGASRSVGMMQRCHLGTRPLRQVGGYRLYAIEAPSP